ncbi:MAG: M15 family metallopeptidase [Psychromonas sp.]|nr:M15 family metallopeptidase [Alteromonadales bacterium]MCP5076478.1 M15 family metallopeptidase [Psychromonas sp.]
MNNYKMKKQLLTILFTTICSTAVSAQNVKVIELSDKRCSQMFASGVISETAPVQCERLREVHFDYIDFQGKHNKDGVMVVMDAVAPYVANIFEGLYKQQFPINKAHPISNYQGDDNRSMDANNSSSFNYRQVIGNSSLSLHAYGLAIDINPVQNPFIEFSDQGNATFSPVDGAKFANRKQYRYGKDNRKGFAEDVVDLFATNGFIYWGGFWNTPIDYQHFQVSRSMANLMVVMSASEAKQFFKQYVDWYQSCEVIYPVAYSQHRVNDYVVYLKQKLAVSSLSETYKTAPQKVLSAIQTPFKRSAVCVKK